MKFLLLFGTLIGITAGAIAQQSSRPTKKDYTLEVIEAARQNGYREGYLAGFDKAAGGRRLEFCESTLMLVEKRAKQAGKYEDCLRLLSAARSQSDGYFKSVADQCVAELP